MNVAKILLYDTDNHILVLHRSSTHPRFPHEADLPGGIIEAGESPEVGVCREVREEAGVILAENEVTLGRERTTSYGRRDIIFTAKLDAVKPEVVISWEHESFDWVRAEEVIAALDTTDDYMIVVREYLAAMRP